MYNLLAFPHYTCGGLLCDILNNTWSAIGPNGGIQNMDHGIGKIGDTSTVFTDYNIDDLKKRIARIKVNDNTWVGTHCWPSAELVQEFNKTIVVSTATSRSQVYRWARAYYHYFKPQWQNLTGMELTDKMRETAKNYVVPYNPVQHERVVNLEFADVVEATGEFRHATKHCECKKHLIRWQEVNSFLYDRDFWNSDVVKSFYQAEHEVKLGRYYIYN